MHSLTIDTKHGLSGRFAMKTPELIHVLRGRSLNDNEQWTLTLWELRPAPGSVRDWERLTWLSWLTGTEGGRYRRIWRATAPVTVMLLKCFEWNTSHTALQQTVKLSRISEKALNNLSLWESEIILSGLTTLTSDQGADGSFLLSPPQ